MSVVVRYVLGSISLILLLVFWVLAAEILQGMGNVDSPYYYNKPYFERYYITSTYMIYLPPVIILKFILWKNELKTETSAEKKIPFGKFLFNKELLKTIALSLLYSVLYFSFGWLWYDTC